MNELNSVFQQSQTANTRPRRPSSSSVFTSYRVIVSSGNTAWTEIVEDRLTELTSLPIGWDGYAGQPVSFTCAYFVANMLERLYQDNVPAPSLVPGSDGSLQVEWHRNMFDVELDVLGAQNVIATRFDHRTNTEEVIEIKNDFTEIVSWIDALADGAGVIEGQN